jgi:putative transposon-encoded protein
MRANIIVRISAEEVLDGSATKFGNGAHVLVPKAWIGAKVKIARLK